MTKYFLSKKLSQPCDKKINSKKTVTDFKVKKNILQIEVNTIILLKITH